MAASFVSTSISRPARSYTGDQTHGTVRAVMELQVNGPGRDVLGFGDCRARRGHGVVI